MTFEPASLVQECVTILRSKSMAMFKRKLLLPVFGVLFGTLLALGLIEILLRVAAPAWLVNQMKELNLARNAAAFGSDVGWSVETIDGKFVRFVPDTSFEVRYYEYNHSVHIDSLGGRVVKDPISREREVPLVPVVGDSFAFGLGVADHETFASLLNSRHGYRIVNLGVPGSALPNQVDQIEFMHKRLGSPSVYLFSFFAGNDYSDIVRYYSKVKLTPEVETKSRTNFISWLDRHVYRNPTLAKSYFLQLLKHTLFKDYFYTGQMMRSILPKPCGIPVKGRPPITSSALMIMTAKKRCIAEVESQVQLAVHQLKKLAERLHFTPVFILIPEKLQVTPSLLQSKAAAAGLRVEELDPQLPTAIIARQLGAQGIMYFDLTGCLQNKTGTYYKADDHFTPEGHRIAAQCIAHELDQKISASLRKD